ncbi:MarR family winged helix-turn-helix transcriptional regulator [Brevibacterium sp. GP-SGM9]|uniref:MarR family winged helix-turn-helix transcriptional regulator n=1 Tax=Brevibacterium sp. GP-SGM9 TaxID=3376990 RepID=UPI0039A540BF
MAVPHKTPSVSPHGDAPSVGPLSGDELATWSALATVLEWLPPVLDAQLHSRWGLTHFEFGILYALSRAEGRALPMSALAGFANSTLSRLSRAVSRLEKRGWAHRATDPDDRRVTIAGLTDSGAELVVSVAPAHDDLVRRLVFDSLTAEQADSLREISLRVTQAISAEGGWRPGR